MMVFGRVVVDEFEFPPCNPRVARRWLAARRSSLFDNRIAATRRGPSLSTLSATRQNAHQDGVTDEVQPCYRQTIGGASKPGATPDG